LFEALVRLSIGELYELYCGGRSDRRIPGAASLFEALVQRLHVQRVCLERCERRGGAG